MEEECPSSVWLCWKVPVGMCLITSTLSPTSLDKAKAVGLLTINVVHRHLLSRNSAGEAIEDALHTEEEVESAEAIPSLMDASIIIPMWIMTVKTLMVRIMRDFPNCRCMGEELAVDALLVILTLENHQMEKPASVSSTAALVLGVAPQSLYKLEETTLFAQRKGKRPSMDTMDLLIALTLLSFALLWGRSTAQGTVWVEEVA